MALTDTDLREVLAQRTAAVPAEAALTRVASVDRRVRVIRRRRAAGASFAVVIVLLVATGVSGLFRSPHERTAPLPAHLQKVAGGLLPRYAGGGEAAASTTFRTDDTRATSLSFTPRALGLQVAIRCDKDMPESQMVSIEVNGKSLMSGSCNTGLNTRGPSWGEEQAEAASLGIVAGRPATMRVRVVQVAKGSAAAPEKLPVYRGAMADYRIGVAVYSPMPVADYPLPPRPDTLEPLGDTPTAGGRLLGTVDSRTVGPTGHGSVETTLTRAGVQVHAYAVAPGAVTVTVNGQTVDVATFWTWDGSGYGGLALTPAALRHLGVDVKVGDHVTVGVAGQRFTDPAWRADVRLGT